MRFLDVVRLANQSIQLNSIQFNSIQFPAQNITLCRKARPKVRSVHKSWPKICYVLSYMITSLPRAFLHRVECSMREIELN